MFMLLMRLIFSFLKLSYNIIKTKNEIFTPIYQKYEILFY